MLINEKKQESNKQKEGERKAEPGSREGREEQKSAYGGHIHTGVLLSDTISFPIISVAVMDKRIRRREGSAVYSKPADAPKISPCY